jgi:plastocyanin
VIALTAHPAVPTPPAATVRTVGITDQRVSPDALVVAPSTTVIWRNHGRNRHTVTADDGRFGSAPLFTGDRFSISAPARPGVYAYHCIFHSYIRGTLTVSLVSLATPGPVDVGRRAALRGTVPSAAAGSPVSVQRRVPGAWVTVADTTANASGAFSATSPALTTRTVFRALAAGSVSPSVRVRVRPVVAVRRHGARLTVRVRPAVSGAAVHLERLDLDTHRWGQVASRRLSAGRVGFTLRSSGVYRAALDARGGLSARASRAVEFRSGALRY